MNKLLLHKFLLFAFLVVGVFLLVGCSIQQPDVFQKESQNVLKFKSTVELEKFLKEKAYYGLYYGLGIRTYYTALEKSSSQTITSTSSGATDYSQTNIQIKGVDEADFVKNDDNYIYLVQNNKLIIVDAFSKKEIISKTEFPEKFSVSNNIFLYKDKIIVIGQSYEESFYFAKYDIKPQTTYETFTKVLIYNIENKEKPVLSEEFKVSGDYFQSRMIDNIVYIVAIKHADYPIKPPIVFAKRIISPSIYYFNNQEEQYNYNTIISIDVNKEKIIDSKTYLLGYGNTLMMSKNNIYIAYQKQNYVCRIMFCEDYTYEKERFTKVIVPLLEGELKENIEKILDMKISDEEQWQLISEELKNFFEKIKDDKDAQEKYSEMLNKIDEAVNEYDTKKLIENSKTIIHKINIDNGKIEYDTKGEVDGKLLNQFSLDEYDGFLRVATTVDIWLNTGRKTYNNVYVLDKSMNIVGSLKNIAKDETIYAARFSGDKLYLVTFKQIDPFFVIDLSNPKEPEILGKLKIPGYSSYLHEYAENLIIGVGKEVDEKGLYTKGVKISLFDTTDVENPKEIDKYVIGIEGTDSPILHDHKAFLLFNDILVIPISEVISKEETYTSEKYKITSYKYWDGAYVFKLSNSGFELLGKVKHDSTISRYYSWWERASVLRSIIMDNELFTISNKYIKVNDIRNELKSIATIEIS